MNEKEAVLPAPPQTETSSHNCRDSGDCQERLLP